MDQSLQGLRVDQSLDVRTMERAVAYAKALERLKQMAENEVLELQLDEGDALNTIPFGLRADGHDILVSEPVKDGVRLLVRKRSLIRP